jgi:hypothetical protein
MMSIRAAGALTLVLALAACGGGDAPPATGGEGTTITLESGLTAQERERFYHLAEGSEVLPYAWFRALHSVSTNRPFLEQPERFGLIADPANRDGLPIGLTAATTVDTRMFGIRMTGLNCAACHVNEVTYRGTRMIVDGAPATFEADSFKGDLFASLSHLKDDPVALLGFLWRLRRGDEPRSPHLPAEAHAAVSRIVGALDPASPEASQDPAARQLLGWARKAIEQERDAPPVDILAGLVVAPPDSAPQEGAAARPAVSLPAPLTYAGVAPVADAIVPDDSVEAHPALLGDAARGAQAAERAEAFISDVILTYRLLKARIHSLRRVLPPVETTTNGWGRVDAFGAARNSIYPQDETPETAPVSYPWLWGFGRQRWFHYDGNTNSIMQRNLGQAIGVGAVYDSVTLVSTLNPWNIHWLELTTRKITPPRWPKNVLGEIDQTLAAQGEQHFATWCARCHTQPTTETLFDPDSIGTDRNRLTNFARPMSDGRTFTEWVAPFLAGVEAQAYRIWKVPADSIRSFQGDTPIVWRTTSRWTARPLDGVWATAPYLHNGSVPTLHDLLLPPQQRPPRFAVGQREYDPAKVGYVAVPDAEARFVFDTSLPGNGNGGHTYGTTLQEAERRALLEYLKTL